VGGFVKHDNPVHAEVQLAAKLRKDYPSGVDVETFESSRGPEAHTEILKLLGQTESHSLTDEEKHNARIVLYGHSWGGAAAIGVARELNNDGIPILLTIQVDSIARVGHNDTIIPANVAQAANFYQPHGILRGAPAIHAADPARTKILGNFLFDYKKSALNCPGYPWWDRYIVKPHTQIECDPVVWNKVDALIRQALTQGGQTALR
jgi:hypothetical protein